MMEALHRSRSGLIALLSLFLLVGAAKAEEKKDPTEDIGKMRVEGIDVVQGRAFRKGLRHEVSLQGGMIANNTFLFYELAELHYTFHLRESLAFEAFYARAFNQDKDIVGDLDNIACPRLNSDINGDGIPDTDCGISLNPPPDALKNVYFGNVIWSPIYGKFSIFSKKIFHFDIFILAGAGLYDNEDSNRFAFNVGVGGKIFLNDWSALRLEFRNFTVREGAPFNHIVNNRLLSLGLSFFFPSSSKG